jgi:tRNA (guanine-N7-)-methyltransferase
MFNSPELAAKKFKINSREFAFGFATSTVAAMQIIAPYTPGLFVHKVESIVERIDVPKLFPKQQPIEVELGSGDGSFIIQWAKLQPHTNFIGVERLLGRLRKVDKKAQRATLTNVRAVRIEASYFLEFLLPEKSIAGLHVYFPDPWPKRKHKVRRLINERFTELAKAALQHGGTVYLEKIPTPEPLKEVKTDFERYFNARGVPTLDATYRLK